MSAVDPRQLQALLQQGDCVLIDVREPVEHAEEHLPAAKLIPLGSINAETTAGIGKDSPIVVHCRSGKRGSEAAQKLAALGFSSVRNLEGGLQACKAVGLPVTRGERKGLPLMQQVQLVIGTGVLSGVILSRLLHPDWVFLSAFFGAGLVFAGSTGWCGLALLMAKMPWNRCEPCCGK
jgi:rhodanese-related sulfurtransferase